MWITMAVLSAFFAGITAVLAKCGIKRTDSDVAMAVRTVVVLLFSWMVTLVDGSWKSLTNVDGRSLVFLILSGAATGASWICYFKALSLGDVNRVVAIDKSSTVLTVLFAIVILQETGNIWVKLGGTLLIAAGTLLMIERKKETSSARGGWLAYSVLSAVFAALTSILAKIGISDVPSNLGTAIRTCVVLLVAWGIVFARKKGGEVRQIDRRELGFICLSGVATGASWLCYYYAIQNGVVSVVVPIDKLSILVAVGFSCLFLKERLTLKSGVGLALITAGTLAMAILS